MQYIVLTPLALLAAAIFGVALSMTLVRYRALPADVPDHFDGYGNPDETGPRPMIFSMILAQVIVLAIWVALLENTLQDADAVRMVAVSGIAANSMLAALALLQSQILGVAQGRFERMPHQYRPLLVIVFGVAIAVATALLLH